VVLLARLSIGAFMHTCFKRPNLFCVDCFNDPWCLTLYRVCYFLRCNRNVTPEEAYARLVVRFPEEPDYRINKWIRQALAGDQPRPHFPLR
jgi:hypothetical protein